MYDIVDLRTVLPQDFLVLLLIKHPKGASWRDTGSLRLLLLVPARSIFSSPKGDLVSWRFQGPLSPKGDVVYCRLHGPLITGKRHSLLEVPWAFIVWCCLSVARSAPWREGYSDLIFVRDELDWLRGCANRCLQEIRPAELLLPEKQRKMFAFLSRHVGHPGKAFLDHTTISKLHPCAYINIKCSSRKNGMWEATVMPHHRAKHHPFRHCRSRIFTIAHMHSMRVAHSTAVAVLRTLQQ